MSTAAASTRKQQPQASTVVADKSEKAKSSPGRAKHMIAGSLAGSTSKLILQPLDLIRTRMQVQDGVGKNEYRGVGHAFRSILRQDGVRGLYRGLTPNLLGSSVSWGTYFTIYNLGKSKWKDHLRNTGMPEKLGPVAHLCCASAAGFTTCFINNPIWIVKTRLQLQGKDIVKGRKIYTGVIDAFTRIVKEEGFLTLYRGMGPALSLVSNGALQFMAYEELKVLAVKYLVDSPADLHSGHWLAMGAVAKVFSSTVTYPLAVMRSRLYQRRPDKATRDLPRKKKKPKTAAEKAAAEAAALDKRADFKYKNAREVIRAIIKYEGPKGFYRGLVAQLLKTTPASAITFFSYESVIKIIDAGNKS